MKRQKKQYRPITGQTWYEKALDWITREENYRWTAVGIGAYGVFLIVGVYLLANILARPDIASIFLRVWFWISPAVIVVALIHPLGGIWGLRAEGKLQKSVKDCLEMYGPCTYDELAARCMPVKIHLGIDSAIEKMLQCHELVWEDDCYRLPGAEDRKKWREQWLAECGAKISFEDLKRIFKFDLKELKENIEIEFSLGERDGYWIGKEENAASGAEIFWFQADAGICLDFAAFQELAEAKLLDGQSLMAVWDGAVLTKINECTAKEWLALPIVELHRAPDNS